MRNEAIVYNTKGLFSAALFMFLFGTAFLWIAYLCIAKRNTVDITPWLPYTALWLGLGLLFYFFGWRVMRKALHYWVAGLRFMYGKN